MKSQALQNLVKNIFSDEKTRLQFLSNPESVISEYDLTEQEKRAVMTTHAKLGLITSDSQQLEATFDPTITWF